MAGKHTEPILLLWRRLKDMWKGLRPYPAGRPSSLRLRERIALDSRHALLLVEADGTRLLVATSQDASTAFLLLPQGREDLDEYTDGGSKRSTPSEPSPVRRISRRAS